MVDCAEEAKTSRLCACVHFPIDNDMGTVVGPRVGTFVTPGAREVRVSRPPSGAD